MDDACETGACPIPQRSRLRDRICVPMKCAVCESCCAQLSLDGKPTGYCNFGGPFAGYSTPTT